MIYGARRKWSTASIEDEDAGIVYCQYCGSKSLKTTETDHRDEFVYYNCVCDDAETEHEIRSAKPPLMPLPDTEFVQDMKYRNELYLLKIRYGKEDT